VDFPCVSLNKNLPREIGLSKFDLKGVTAKTSPNKFLTSKMALYSSVFIVFVSNVKANVQCEK
jgi:hypothetical protein